MTPDPTKPSQESMEKAAQLWCLPRHQHKVMDPDLAVDIALLLDRAPARADLAKAARQFHDEIHGTLSCYSHFGQPTICQLREVLDSTPPPASKSEDALGLIGVKALQAQYAVEAGGANESLTKAADLLAEIRNLSLFPQDAKPSKSEDEVREECAQIVDRYWMFSGSQQPLASWHEKQACLEALRGAGRKA